MDNVLVIIVVILSCVNVCGIAYASTEIEFAYGINSDHSDEESLALMLVSFFGTLIFTMLFYSINMQYLALLLPTAILIVNILAVILAKKVDYKRNVKPYLQIKL